MRTNQSEHIFLSKKWEYLSYIISFAVAMGLARMEYSVLAGVVLMGEGIYLYVMNFQRTKCFVDIRGLFSLSWVFGIGLTCLKLSQLQQNWKMMTWLCFFCAYGCFMVGYDFYEMKQAKKRVNCSTTKECNLVKEDAYANRIFHCILALSIASVVCFLVEAMVVGFIPLFSPEPHAYSYFHVSGVHYFTISCILNPALTVLYIKSKEKIEANLIPFLIGANVIAVAIPILCVSRFQLLFAVGFAAVTYLMVYRKITWKMIIIAICIMIPAYVLLSVARRHDVTYLNGIFEMKNVNMPIFVTQPYMYVANNFENFNCLVEQLPKHTMGLRMFFPVLALTGLKFLLPQLVSFPNYITKKELTTLTMFYDSYYDFGIIGVILLALILGIVAAWITTWIRRSKNPMSYLFYGQIAIYMGLAFFTTWFSNPTTWFWLVITGMFYVYVGFGNKKLKKKQNADGGN